LTGSENYRFHSDASYLRYEVAKSIVEKSDVSIPDGLGVRGKDGRDYSWLAPGSALLATPFYLIGKLTNVQPQILVSFENPFFAAATAALLFLLAQSLGFSSKASILVSLLYSLGTIAWPASKQAFDHPLETFCILLSAYFLHRYKGNEKTRHILFAGGAAGMAFLTRPTTVLILPAAIAFLSIFYLRKSRFIANTRNLIRDIILLLISFFPFAGISFWYNHYRFGSVLETGYSLIAARTGLDFFTGTSLITGITGFLFSPGKGFFFYSPVAILFFFSIRTFVRKHPEVGAFFICLTITYLILLSKNIYWHGDWAWGPRYLLAVTPALVLPIAHLIDSAWWSRKTFRLFTYGLFCISFTIQLVAVSVNPLKYFYYLICEENVIFSSATGEGVQPIMEPPTEVYFDWEKSPIPAQFRFANEIAFRSKPFKPTKLPENATITEKLNASPDLNLYDFWWVYMYFINGISSVFLVVFSLVCLTAHAGINLFRARQ
jgi:4-amino-4-deoxy-L-arabinose transferase-like glycosyltransferase